MKNGITRRNALRLLFEVLAVSLLVLTAWVNAERSNLARVCAIQNGIPAYNLDTAMIDCKSIRP